MRFCDLNFLMGFLIIIKVETTHCTADKGVLIISTEMKYINNAVIAFIEIDSCDIYNANKNIYVFYLYI